MVIIFAFEGEGSVPKSPVKIQAHPYVWAFVENCPYLWFCPLFSDLVQVQSVIELFGLLLRMMTQWLVTIARPTCSWGRSSKKRVSRSNQIRAAAWIAARYDIFKKMWSDDNFQEKKCVSFTFKTGEECRRHYCLVHDKMGQFWWHWQTAFNI